jgi:acetyl esterase/lipase
MKYLNRTLIIIVLLFIANSIVFAQNNYPPVIDCSKEVTYKEVDNVKLNLWIFNPPKHSLTDKTPAIVFFFGGGWSKGSPTAFVKHCELLSARGMVAIVADYRVKSRHNVAAKACVSDAKSAVRWIRQHAVELGIDPDRIAAGGGSAGGHLAAATATLSNFDEANENNKISSKPNALALFNPALVLAPVDAMDVPAERMKRMEARMGAKLESMSPYHNINKDMPPTIIFHGTGDKSVPFSTIELFTKKMKENGNSCVLVAYKDAPHGFFNYKINYKKANGAFIDTIHKMEKFFVSLGYLEDTFEASVYE